MKKLFLLSLLCYSFSIQSQEWAGVGSEGITSGDDIVTIASYNGDVIVGGDFEEIDGILVNYVARWDGNTWHAMGSGFDEEVRALVVYNDELYAAGKFQRDGTNTNDLYSLAKWTGSTWVNVAPNDWYSLYMLDVIGDELYISRRNANQQLIVSVFDGVNFTDLPYELKGPPNYIEINGAMTYDNDTMIYGRFDSVNTTEAVHITSVSGGAASSVGFPCSIRDGAILFGYMLDAIEVQGTLYVGGIFNNYNGGGVTPSMAAYKDGAWTSHLLDANVTTTIKALTANDNYLFAGGNMERWNQDATQLLGDVVAYDLSTESFLDLGFFNENAGNEAVEDLLLVGDTLFAVGGFSAAGANGSTKGIAKMNIASLQGGGEEPDGLEQQLASSIKLYPNPAGDWVNISGFSGGSIMLDDLNGRRILSTTSPSIDLSDVPAGVYILQVLTEEQHEVRKLIRK